MRLVSRHVEHAGPTVSPEWPVSLQYVLTPLIHGKGLSQVLSPEPMFLDQSHNGHRMACFRPGAQSAQLAVCCSRDPRSGFNGFPFGTVHLASLN
jgi:hypothetical protein